MSDPEDGSNIIRRKIEKYSLEDCVIYQNVCLFSYTAISASHLAGRLPTT
jgi:hypothetical protein